MKIIDKKQLKSYVKVSLGSSDNIIIKIYSFKKDRCLIIIKEKYSFVVLEQGFYKREFQFLIQIDAIKTIMKLSEIEFKNSHKLYVQHMC